MTKGTPSTATFTMTAGAASAVTLVVGTPGALPNGTYQLQWQTDETGGTLVLVTPMGTIEVPNFVGQGWG